MVGMARRAVPVAERSVRRRNETVQQPSRRHFHIAPANHASMRPFRARTAQRAVPTKSPFKLRTLTIGEINKRPVLRSRHEFFPHGIFHNVICLLPPAFIVPQPMFKEVALPADAGLLGRPFFPLAHHRLQRLAGRREGNQRVQMIRHQEKNVRPPKKFLLPVTDGFKQTDGNLRPGEVVGKTFPAIDADEINFRVRVHPQRDGVGQSFSLGNVHAQKLSDNKTFPQTKNSGHQPAQVGTARCAVPARRAERTWLDTRLARSVPSPDAALGDGDGAARCPYQPSVRRKPERKMLDSVLCPAQSRF